jgi:hypothetical protein
MDHNKMLRECIGKTIKSTTGIQRWSEEAVIYFTDGTLLALNRERNSEIELRLDGDGVHGAYMLKAGKKLLQCKEVTRITGGSPCIVTSYEFKTEDGWAVLEWSVWRPVTVFGRKVKVPVSLFMIDGGKEIPVPQNDTKTGKLKKHTPIENPWADPIDTIGWTEFPESFFDLPKEPESGIFQSTSFLYPGTTNYIGFSSKNKELAEDALRKELFKVLKEGETNDLRVLYFVCPPSITYTSAKKIPKWVIGGDREYTAFVFLRLAKPIVGAEVDKMKASGYPGFGWQGICSERV